jgi:hypothetical protein
MWSRGKKVGIKNKNRGTAAIHPEIEYMLPFHVSPSWRQCQH